MMNLLYWYTVIGSVIGLFGLSLAYRRGRPINLSHWKPLAYFIFCWPLLLVDIILVITQKREP